MEPPFRLRRISGLDFLESALGRREGARLIVTTRRGGLSFDRGDLNLSFGTNDGRDLVNANRAKVFGALGIFPARFAGLRQKHSTKIVYLDESNIEKAAKWDLEGDALITRNPGFWLSISIGDCLAVALYNSRRKVLALAHAGWAGTAGRIVELVLKRMKDEFECLPGETWAALSPCIHRSHYQVDGPVFEVFAGNWNDWEHFFADRNAGRGYLDLPAANMSLLVEGGIPREQILDFGLCTYSLPALFSSHRREGAVSGRMLVLASMTETAN